MGLVLFNSVTQEMLTIEEVQAGGTEWVLLNPENYPEYQNPAFYNMSSHEVLDSTPDNSVSGWILTTQ